MGILKLLLLLSIFNILICLRVHSNIFQFNMISIEILNESNIITLLLLTWCLKYIRHASTAWNVSSVRRSWNYVSCRNLWSIESTRISFLVNNLLYCLCIYRILKLRSFCIINTIVKRLQPYSCASNLLLLICITKIWLIIFDLVWVSRRRYVMIYLLILRLSYLILNRSLFYLSLHWKSWDSWKLSRNFSSI